MYILYVLLKETSTFKTLSTLTQRDISQLLESGFQEFVRLPLAIPHLRLNSLSVVTAC